MGNTVDRLLASRSGLVLPSSRVYLAFCFMVSRNPFPAASPLSFPATEIRQSNVSPVVCFALLREVLQKHRGPGFSAQTFC